jgi:hypothetical protein
VGIVSEKSEETRPGMDEAPASTRSGKEPSEEQSQSGSPQHPLVEKPAKGSTGRLWFSKRHDTCEQFEFGPSEELELSPSMSANFLSRAKKAWYRNIDASILTSGLEEVAEDPGPFFAALFLASFSRKASAPGSAQSRKLCCFLQW